MKKDWVQEVRSQTPNVSVADLSKVITTALQDVRELKQSIFEQEPILEEMLNNCRFILEGRRPESAIITMPRPPARTSRERGELVRKMALELVALGKHYLLTSDIIDALVARGFTDFAGKGKAGSIGTVLAHMPEFKRRGDTKEFEYVGRNGLQTTLGSLSEERELAVGRPNGSGQS